MNDKCQKSTSEVLEQLHKTVTMGKESLLDVMPKVRDKKLKDELTRQLSEYEKYTDEITELLKKHGGKTQTESIVTKMSAKIGIEMGTLTDKSEQHIAQMVIEGTTMGITDTIRLIRDYENTSCAEEALSLAKRIADFEEKAVERTKKFL